MKARAAVVFIAVGLVCILVSGSFRGSGQKAQVTFPVLSDMMLDADNPEFILCNPSENSGKYILRYEFVNTVTGDVFFSTNWLEGGKQYHYLLNDLKDTVSCRIHIYAKDADTYEDASGVNIFIKIGVGDYET